MPLSWEHRVLVIGWKFREEKQVLIVDYKGRKFEKLKRKWKEIVKVLNWCEESSSYHLHRLSYYREKVFRDESQKTSLNCHRKSLQLWIIFTTQRVQILQALRWEMGKNFAQTSPNYVDQRKRPRMATCECRHASLISSSGSESIKINTAAAGQNQTKNLMSSAHSIEI